MRLSYSLLPEFDQEMASTRKSIERLPADKLAWKPHEKSMTMGQLAVHLAEIHHWALDILQKDSVDIAPPGGSTYQSLPADSPQEILQTFDKNVFSARAAIAGTSDEQFLKPWSLLNGGKLVFTLPRIAVLRSFILSHTIHHRAQLGVYLRLNNIPVPAIYGPSADEGEM